MYLTPDFNMPDLNIFEDLFLLIFSMLPRIFPHNETHSINEQDH